MIIVFGTLASDDYKPVGWMGRYPIRLTTIMVALFVLGMFATVIAESARWDVIEPLALRTGAFWHGAIWQPFTCVLIQGASFFFIFSVLFLYWSGVEVERYLGQRRYLILLALLLLVPVVMLTAWSAAGVESIYYGSYEISIGMFIAFATLYPGVELFGWVTLKWLAFASLVLGTMQYLPNHEWSRLSILWGMCLTSFGYIKFLQKGGEISWPQPVAGWFRRRPKFRVVPKETVRDPDDDVCESIDPLLEKISKSGIGSLSASERRALDRARNRLLKKQP